MRIGHEQETLRIEHRDLDMPADEPKENIALKEALTATSNGDEKQNQSARVKMRKHCVPKLDFSKAQITVIFLVPSTASSCVLSRRVTTRAQDRSSLPTL